MAEPTILTTLRAKRSEIERHIDGLTASLTEARSDLVHIAAALRIFDFATSDDKPATSYQGATKAIGHSDLLTLCKAALVTSEGPLSTRELARYVIESEGWSANDRRLQMTVAHRVSGLMTRMMKRGGIQRAGMRDRVALWRLP